VTWFFLSAGDVFRCHAVTGQLGNPTTRISPPRSLVDVKTVAPCRSPDVIATPLIKYAVLLDISLDEGGGI
jgi:hypothetical protein